MERADLAGLWPLFGLRVRTPVLELRYPDDHDLAALASLSGDIHDDDFLPFSGTWSLLPDGERERAVLQYHWGRRGDFSAASWRLELVVVVDGEVVGTQGAIASDYAITRTLETGSWLGRAHQGKGLGKEMRAAILHLAFEGLGALRADTGAVEGNAASLAVTARMGYQANGDSIDATNGVRTRLLRFTLERDAWLRARRDDIEVVGLEPCLELFGLGTSPGDEIA